MGSVVSAASGSKFPPLGPAGSVHYLRLQARRAPLPTCKEASHRLATAEKHSWHRTWSRYCFQRLAGV